MHDTIKVLLLGTLLAAATGGIAYWDFPAMDMEPTSDNSVWWVVGLPFVVSVIVAHVLKLPHPWELAWLIHWAFCTMCAWPLVAAVRDWQSPP